MAESEPWVKVEIINAKGSTPRDVGAVLWVSKTQISGSIGGGNMENDAISFARSMLSLRSSMGVALSSSFPMNSSPSQVSGDLKSIQTKRYILGPDTGQCCGGVVDIAVSLEEFQAPAKSVLAIFGAGHVGAVLARLAKALEIDAQLFDARAHIELPNPEPYHPIALPEMAMDALPDRAAIVIMTHDHGLDFLLTEAALKAERFAFVGMIGSKSKATRFKNQHGELARKLISPIAKSSNDKRPEAIALAILSEIWPRVSPLK